MRSRAPAPKHRAGTPETRRHTAEAPDANYKRVPSRLRRTRLPSPVHAATLGPSAYRLHWMFQLCTALVVFSFVLESLPRLGTLTAANGISWASSFLVLQLVNACFMVFFGLQRRVVLWPSSVAVALTALELLSLPMPSGGSIDQHPWLPWFMLLSSCMLVYSWGLGAALTFCLVSAACYLAFAWPLPDSAFRGDGWAAATSLGARLAFSLIAVLLVQATFRAATSADEAYNDAVAKATALQRARSQAEDQERLDRLIHDNVMAALLDASRHQGAPHKRTRELAQRAMSVLAFEERRAQGTATTPVHVLVDDLLDALSPWRARVRFNSISPHIRPAGQPRAFLPTEIAQALVQAVTESVSNSARHSGAELTYVRMDGGECPATSINPQGFYLSFEVQDHGRGFQVRSMDARRLGVRVSIIGNVENVGGRVEIASAPSRGTRVTIMWPRDAEPAR